eukprot:TRINITY_DN5283_c1_g1_i4.p1 TRINITY_DN5283_c1_g1~~TRINITY_DN5283_c1_g1_i4.p1  ORF type:complete len:599 (+),score=118.04 TRINITY_DN5283_c1_g1_i4:140-1936(+)
MREYESGKWGFALLWGLKASVFPRALAVALPNGALTLALSYYFEEDLKPSNEDEDRAKYAFSIGAGFTSVLFFVLYFRSNVAYSRWWEGGTLLQQVRGEWFNAFSSLIAFSSTDPAMAGEVEKYHHMLARLMSLLFCCALQQVSPNRRKSFEIIDTEGIDPVSLEFLGHSPDKVEIILQWIQRSTVVNMARSILTVPPPVMSRAFQELSRGVVNLQNARKIADFPFPFPYAQTSIFMLLIHWVLCPFLTNILVSDRWLAMGLSMAIVFFPWCINFIALQLEMPFGEGDNDLPMEQMQADWNKSVGTLLMFQAQRPPEFAFNQRVHCQLVMSMSDDSQEQKWLLSLPMNVRPSNASQASDDEAEKKGYAGSSKFSPSVRSSRPSRSTNGSSQYRSTSRSTASTASRMRPSDAPSLDSGVAEPPSRRASRSPSPEGLQGNLRSRINVGLVWLQRPALQPQQRQQQQRQQQQQPQQQQQQQQEDATAAARQKDSWQKSLDQLNESANQLVGPVPQPRQPAQMRSPAPPREPQSAQQTTQQGIQSGDQPPQLCIALPNPVQRLNAGTIEERISEEAACVWACLGRPWRSSKGRAGSLPRDRL